MFCFFRSRDRRPARGGIDLPASSVASDHGGGGCGIQVGIRAPEEELVFGEGEERTGLFSDPVLPSSGCASVDVVFEFGDQWTQKRQGMERLGVCSADDCLRWSFDSGVAL